MIHAVTGANATLYKRQLIELHEKRYQYYVEARGWSDLIVKDGGEYDEFDTDQAVYLLNLTKDGHLRASFRIMPTTAPYLLTKLSEFVDGPPPASPHIWDMTRWIITPQERRKDGQHRSIAQAELGCGLFEFAQTRNITHYTTLLDTYLLPRLEVSGWTFEPLGSERVYGERGEKALAILIDAGPSALRKIRDNCAIHVPQLYEAPPPAPFETTEDALIKASFLARLNDIPDLGLRQNLVNVLFKD
jgi:N-acyl-L-homoserine lactone synthetase